MTRAEVQAGIAAYITTVRDKPTWTHNSTEAAAHIMRTFVDPYKATEEGP